VRRLLVTVSVVPISPILVTLIKEALSSSETRFLQEPHGVTSQSTPFFEVTAVKTSNEYQDTSCAERAIDTCLKLTTSPPSVGRHCGIFKVSLPSGPPRPVTVGMLSLHRKMTCVLHYTSTPTSPHTRSVVLHYLRTETALFTFTSEWMCILSE
jgi:hypothetical protein